MTSPFPATTFKDDGAVEDASSTNGGMIWIPDGTFRMGSDKHYPEEAPVHRVTVDGFWMDRYPVTNRQFRAFVKATGHVTVAEIVPDPKDYPGMLPHMVYAGSLCSRRPTIRSTCATSASGGRSPRAPTGDTPTAPEAAFADWTTILSCMWPSTTRSPMRNGSARICQPKRNGNLRRAAGSMAPSLRGAKSSRRMAVTWPIPGRVNFHVRTPGRTASNAPPRSPHSRRTVTGCTT